MSEFDYLPKEFLSRMESDLGSDFHAFLSSYERDKICALRVNKLKEDLKTRDLIKPLVTHPVKWCPEGYYYDEERVKPGSHPYHHCGLYYIQDASAQAPAELLDVNPGMKVLDLCAAPGGKSTQLAGKLMGEGIIVSNEPNKQRAKILSENMERLGVKNAIVVSEFPDKLADKFPLYFDRILVDAPCSGEGMFRKNHEACKEWSLENVQMCASRQADILDSAYEMLVGGGKLVYSTCTFAKAEDEDAIAAFIERHPDMKLILQNRLWPHEIEGEGHFEALLEKSSEEQRIDSLMEFKKINKSLLVDFEEFEKNALNITFNENLYLVQDQLYALPKECLDFSGIHVIRGGLHLGTLKKNRFEPSHALALAIKPSDATNVLNLSSDDVNIGSYLKGQTICADNEDGWTLICVDGYSIGWGKTVKGVVKNHYPKGLRSF